MNSLITFLKIVLKKMFISTNNMGQIYDYYRTNNYLILYLSYIKLQSIEKAQNLKSKNKKICIKTEMEKYKNNTINRLEIIKNVCCTFLPQ